MLNGGYGALGNENFLYYMVENAEAITMSGQLVNKWTSGYIDNFLREILGVDHSLWVYSDTDSAYFTLKPFVDTLGEVYQGNRDKIADVIDQFYKEVVDPKIQERSQEMVDYMNCYEQRMFWDREIIAESGVWVGKKKYVLSVIDSEGTRYPEPKMKIMGMESVKSSTPEWSRNALKKCYQIALQEDQETLHQLLGQLRSKFDAMTVDEIAIPRGIKGIEKYHVEDGERWKSKTPRHVKAAISHNRMVERLGVRQIPFITDGDHIKFVELLLPNPAGAEVIAFDTYIPREFNIEKYVDRDMMYDKSFMSALRIFLGAIGWSEEPTVDLFSF